MTKDQILKSLSIEMESTRKELADSDKYGKMLLNGRLEGMRYARSLVVKFEDRKE